MTVWSLAFTPTFFNETLNIPKAVQKKLDRAVRVLQRDPISADGDAKKLQDYDDKIYRIRLGDYRVFYSIGDGWVKLLSIRKRDGRTYRDKLTDTEPPAVAPPAATDGSEAIDPIAAAPTPAPPPPEPVASTPTADKPLPAPITADQLEAWRIPAAYRANLLSATSEDQLLQLDLPTAIFNRILDNLYPRDLEEIAAQPEYILPDLDNIERLFEGDLAAFLLKLDPEQQKLCDFGHNGPVLVKGGAGTGKSTLALYRVKTLKARGFQRILFTTYTNALIHYSEQLLAQLLGQPPVEAGVTVATVDNLIVNTYRDRYGNFQLPNAQQMRQGLETAIAQTEMPGANSFARRARRDALTKLGADYLLEELLGVIESNGLDSLEAYQAWPRRGRGLPLQANVRAAIWAVYETWQRELGANWVTWEQVRSRALAAVRGQPPAFDAIVIDEAQDLSPVALRYLLALVPDFSGLYFTADSSQSLYQRGFSWKQVHEDLNVTGRTVVLKRNYRNTAEIVAACDRIFADSDAADAECRLPEPAAARGETPQVWVGDDRDRESEILANFFIDAARRHRLPLHGGAVLCPSNALRERYVAALGDRGLQARAVSKDEIDLDAPYIKVLTLYSAKGLEFPFVAVVGLERGRLPYRDAAEPPEEQEPQLNQQRRLFYVGCSRAMRSLLVCGSAAQPSEFLDHLTPPEWQAIAPAQVA